MSFANQGADRIANLGMNVGLGMNAGPGMDAALRESHCLAKRRDKEIRCDEGYAAFALFSVDESRYGADSHAKLEGQQIVAGITGGRKLAPGDLTLAAFIEYGDGDYDTRTRLAKSPYRIHGSGVIKYVGAGLLGRLDGTDTDKGHPHAEGSIRVGRLKNDFNADFALSSGKSVPGHYDSSTLYYSLHLGTGYAWKIADTATLEAYAQYLHARRSSERTQLSTPNTGKNDLRFKAIESHRLKIGGRYTGERNSERVQAYLGLAYEHEFNSKARASIDGLSISNSPDIKGGTGIAEIGLTVSPSPGQPVSVDFGIQGYAGKREGMSATLRVEYRF